MAQIVRAPFPRQRVVPQVAQHFVARTAQQSPHTQSTRGRPITAGMVVVDGQPLLCAPCPLADKALVPLHCKDSVVLVRRDGVDGLQSSGMRGTSIALAHVPMMRGTPGSGIRCLPRERQSLPRTILTGGPAYRSHHWNSSGTRRTRMPASTTAVPMPARIVCIIHTVSPSRDGAVDPSPSRQEQAPASRVRPIRSGRTTTRPVPQTHPQGRRPGRGLPGWPMRPQ